VYSYSLYSQITIKLVLEKSKIFNYTSHVLESNLVFFLNLTYEINLFESMY